MEEWKWMPPQNKDTVGFPQKWYGHREDMEHKPLKTKWFTKEEPVEEDTPFYKNKWVIGGAIIAILIIGGVVYYYYDGNQPANNNQPGGLGQPPIAPRPEDLPIHAPQPNRPWFSTIRNWWSWENRAENETGFDTIRSWWHPNERQAPRVVRHAVIFDGEDAPAEPIVLQDNRVVETASIQDSQTIDAFKEAAEDRATSPEIEAWKSDSISDNESVTSGSSSGTATPTNVVEVLPAESSSKPLTSMHVRKDSGSDIPPYGGFK